eukprot:scaffold74881_cov17-Prasinocladus_malaysianus.AAC.1
MIAIQCPCTVLSNNAVMTACFLAAYIYFTSELIRAGHDKLPCAAVNKLGASLVIVRLESIDAIGPH